MNASSIHVTEADRERLTELLQDLAARQLTTPGTRDLERELERATVVAPEDIPPDVVTMNSQFDLRDVDTDEVFHYTLCYPEDSNPDAGKISVLAPVGTAVLGYRIGSVITWKVPAGTRRLRIEAVSYQPEARKHFDL
jgi:regulator of nucleoside diphosphate kinase